MDIRQKLITRAEAIENQTNENDIWEEFETTIAEVGIDFYIYLTTNSKRTSPRIATNTPIHQNMAEEIFDPFLDYCCQSYQATKTGAEFLKDYPYLDESSKQFILNAANFGFLSGLGIPMRLQGSERFGGFNLGTRFKREEFEELILPLTDSLRLFCLIVHRRVEELSADEKTPEISAFRRRLISPPMEKLNTLSPREREVLFLISKGFSRKLCAQMCKISEHTVSTHMKNAYSKLGVSNKAQATRIVVEADFSLSA